MKNHCLYYSLLRGDSQCLRASCQPISNPLIKAFIFGTRCNHCLFVNIRRNTHVKAPRIGFFWGYSLLSAYLKENTQRCLAFLAQVVDIVGVKVCATVQADKLPAKHFNVRVVANNGFVLAKCHDVVHGVTSLSFSQLRMLATAPLSVVGLGWGRWNTLTSSNKNTATREPSRSLISAPSAIKSASMSDHLILALTGRVNIATKVRSCFRFISSMVLQNSITSKTLLDLGRPPHNKNPLTREAFNARIKSLTKTCSGNPRPKANAVFLCLSKVQTRHSFMVGLERLIQNPLGNKRRRLQAVSATHRPYLNGVVITKLNLVGGYHA